MAMGAYYRASGKMSASIVTAGAGASNAITGIVSNWADSIPGIIISGNEGSNYIKDHGYLLNLPLIFILKMELSILLNKSINQKNP